MEYSKLTNAEYKQVKLSKSDMWDTFNWLFSRKTRNNSSYKFLFFKAIIECFDKKDENGKISYDCLFDMFTRLSWNIIVEYGIVQQIKASDKRGTLLEIIINDYVNENNYYETRLNNNIINDPSWKLLCEDIKKNCKKYVVGSLYGDTKEVFYSFSNKEEWVIVNPQMESFVEENRAVIENLNYYKWAEFYKSINNGEISERLQNKISNSFLRNESIFRSILAYEFEKEDNCAVYEYVPTANTLEWLLSYSEDTIETADIIESISEDDIENQIFSGYKEMRKYLDNPIMLVNKLKEEKGIFGL